nr:FAD-dependent oxidoreductase [Nitratireductor alexandrii]
MKTHAHVVVIGGGAVGMSILYHLAKAGVSDTLLIEKNELTSGSTWHAAGNIPTYANSQGGMRAGNYAWRLYKDLAQAVDAPITYRHTGAFWTAQTQERVDFYRHLVGIADTLGYDLRMLTPCEMEAMHPYYTAGTRVIGGLYDPYEGDADPSQLTQALAKGARDLGAAIARFTTVRAITRRPSGDWLVASDRGDVVCQVVVNAAGYYGRRVGQMVGQSLPIVTLEHQYLVTEALAELEADPANFPLVRDPDSMFYLRRERNGLLMGSYGHAGRAAWLDGMPDCFANQLFPDSVDDMMEVLEAALEHIPLLRQAGVRRFVNGPIPYSPDGAPLCGPAYGLPNVFHACGFPVGITHSAAAGKAIAEWISEGETEWDMAAWDPRRFGDWAGFDYAVDRACDLYEHQYAIPYPHRHRRLRRHDCRPADRAPGRDGRGAKAAGPAAAGVRAALHDHPCRHGSGRAGAIDHRPPLRILLGYPNPAGNQVAKNRRYVHALGRGRHPARDAGRRPALVDTHDDRFRHPAPGRRYELERRTAGARADWRPRGQMRGLCDGSGPVSGPRNRYGPVRPGLDRAGPQAGRILAAFRSWPMRSALIAVDKADVLNRAGAGRRASSRTSGVRPFALRPGAASFGPTVLQAV